MVFFENRPADNLLLLHRSRRAVRNYVHEEDAERVYALGFTTLNRAKAWGLPLSLPPFTR